MSIKQKQKTETGIQIILKSKTHAIKDTSKMNAPEKILNKKL